MTEHTNDTTTATEADTEPAGPVMVEHDGLLLDQAGLTAAADLLLQRAAAHNVLSSAGRKDLVPETLREYDAFAAELIATYLRVANHDHAKR